MGVPTRQRADVWTRAVAKGEAKALVDKVLADSVKADAQTLVVDGDMVFGVDHLDSALAHASKAVVEGRNASDSLAMETILYASGERQLSSALRKMGVTQETEMVVLAVVAGSYSPGEGWSRLEDSPGPPDKARLKRFGVTEKEMSTIAADKLSELVLERVAAVDVVKK